MSALLRTRRWASSSVTAFCSTSFSTRCLDLIPFSDSFGEYFVPFRFSYVCFWFYCHQQVEGFSLRKPCGSRRCSATDHADYHLWARSGTSAGGAVMVNRPRRRKSVVRVSTCDDLITPQRGAVASAPLMSASSKRSWARAVTMDGCARDTGHVPGRVPQPDLHLPFLPGCVRKVGPAISGDGRTRRVSGIQYVPTLYGVIGTPAAGRHFHQKFFTA